MLGRIKDPAVINRINSMQCAILWGSIIALNVYSLFLNPENHTGLKIGYLVFFYLVAFFVNLADLAAEKRRPMRGVNRNLLVIIVALAVMGALEVAFLEKLDIMMEHSVWIERGMPTKPDIFGISLFD